MYKFTINVIPVTVCSVSFIDGWNHQEKYWPGKCYIGRLHHIQSNSQTFSNDGALIVQVDINPNTIW